MTKLFVEQPRLHRVCQSWVLIYQPVDSVSDIGWKIGAPKRSFDVSGKRYNFFQKTLSKRNFFCEAEKSWYLGGCKPFYWLISSKIVCLNALKIRFSFVKSKPKHSQKLFLFGSLKTWRPGRSKILGRFLFCPKFWF